MLLTMSICIISDSDNCHDHSSVVRNTLQQQQEDVTTSLKNLGCSCYILILKFEEQSTRIRRRNNFVMAKYNEGGVKLRKNSVFGPHTVSDEVYEVAAKLAVKAATEGVNGTIFAYGVTSSADAPESCGLENSIANSADSPSSQPDSKLLVDILG
ncbi:kinesin protein KIN-7K, chloroplastic [Trifolium repens]|nr:kinesin protein KIN-7K, chloroplastic [Trifolium repens]